MVLGLSLASRSRCYSLPPAYFIAAETLLSHVHGPDHFLATSSRARVPRLISSARWPATSVGGDAVTRRGAAKITRRVSALCGSTRQRSSNFGACGHPHPNAAAAPAAGQRQSGQPVPYVAIGRSRVSPPCPCLRQTPVHPIVLVAVYVCVCRPYYYLAAIRNPSNSPLQSISQKHRPSRHRPGGACRGRQQSSQCRSPTRSYESSAHQQTPKPSIASVSARDAGLLE